MVVLLLTFFVVLIYIGFPSTPLPKKCIRPVSPGSQPVSSNPPVDLGANPPLLGAVPAGCVPLQVLERTGIPALLQEQVINPLGFVINVLLSQLRINATLGGFYPIGASPFQIVPINGQWITFNPNQSYYCNGSASTPNIVSLDGTLVLTTTNLSLGPTSIPNFTIACTANIQVIGTGSTYKIGNVTITALTITSTASSGSAAGAILILNSFNTQFISAINGFLTSSLQGKDTGIPVFNL